MTIVHLAIVDRLCRTMLSYFFTPATVTEQVEWEGRLAGEVKPLLEASFKQDVPLGIGEDRYVLLRGVSDMIFIVTGCGLDDELALVGVMDHAVACVTATCDRRLTPAHVVDFHGKICVCLDEMFFGGVLAHADVDAVLRASKLKPYR